MRKIFLFTAGIALFCLVAFSAFKNTGSRPAAVMKPLPAKSNMPEFRMRNVNGNIISLQSLQGKKIFLNLWATWCPPCRAELPSIEKLARSVDTNKVSFVMLSLDDHFEEAKSFFASRKIHLPVYYPAENLPDLLTVKSIPSTFLFDNDGELLLRIDGANNYNTKEFKRLLGQD